MSIVWMKGGDSMATPPTRRTRAFISYSHVDKMYLEQLQKYLKPYLRDEDIRVWDDTQIRPGEKWRAEIEQAIEFAKVAILLISPDFLASDFIAEEELPRLLLAAEQEGATILPIILRPSAFLDTKLGEFQAVNSPARPLSGMTAYEQETEWTNIARLIRDRLRSSGGTVVLEELLKRFQKATAQEMKIVGSKYISELYFVAVDEGISPLASASELDMPLSLHPAPQPPDPLARIAPHLRNLERPPFTAPTHVSSLPLGLLRRLWAYPPFLAPRSFEASVPTSAYPRHSPRPLLRGRIPPTLPSGWHLLS
jgi:hypothetical protein